MSAQNVAVEPSGTSRRPGDILWPATVLAAWLGSSILFIPRFYQLRGVPWSIVSVMVNRGAMLYRDIAASITPLSIHIEAAWFRLTAPSVNADRWLGALATLGTAIIAYALIRRLTRQAHWAGMAGLVVIIWGAGQLVAGVWGDTYYRMAELFALAALAGLAWPRKSLWLAGAGGLGALAYFTYQPAGAIIALTLLMCWLLEACRSISARGRSAGGLGRLGFYTAAGASFGIGYLLLKQVLVPPEARGDFALFTTSLPRLYVSTYAGGWGHALRESLSPGASGGLTRELLSLEWMLPGAFVAWAALAVAAWRCPAGPARRACVALLAAALAGMLPAIWHPAVFRMMAHVTVPLALVFALLVTQVPSRRARAVWTGLMVVFIAAGASRAVWVASWKSQELVRCPGGTLWMRHDDAQFLREVIPQLRADAGANGGRVFLLGRGAQLYLLSGTLPATRYVFNVDALLGPEQYSEQAQAIERLRPLRVYGIYTEPGELASYPYAAPLVEELEQRYRVAHSSGRGQAWFELLVRK